MSNNGNERIKKINRIAGKIQNNRYLKATMTGMMATMPVMMTSALVTILKNLPIDAYKQFIEASNLVVFFDIPINILTNITALLVVVSVTHSLAKSFKQESLLACIIAVVAFLILTPMNAIPNQWGMIDYSIPASWLGAQGMFTALITSIVSTRLFVYFNEKKITIKLPESVPEFVSNSFSAVLPAIIILLLFTLVSGLMTFTEYGSIHQFIYSILQKPLGSLGSSIWSLMFLSLLSQLLWFFGIHGGMVVLGSISFILMPMDIIQLQAYAAGNPLPNITGMAFFLFFTGFITLPVILISLFVGKSKRYKTLSKMSLVPAVFAIDEPMIFGTPLVMNFKFFIPFVLQGVIGLGLAYLATVIGIIPKLPAVGIPNGIPIIMTGFLQGSWKFALFQVFLVALRMILWFPFFKSADKEALAEEMSNDAANSARTPQQEA